MESRPGSGTLKPNSRRHQYLGRTRLPYLGNMDMPDKLLTLYLPTCLVVYTSTILLSTPEACHAVSTLNHQHCRRTEIACDPQVDAQETLVIADQG